MTTRRAILLREKYPSIASSLLRPLLNVFISAREVCDGDIDKFVIILVIAMRTTEHPEFKALRHEEMMAGRPAILPSLGINIRSVAASIGIPKETARRKLSELVDAGWLVREHWDFRLTTRGYAELDPVRRRVQSLALTHHDQLTELFSA